MATILTIDNLSKHFGKIQAVNKLNLVIEEGQIFGILGPNGSGKTTTLGLILDVVAPNQGSFRWFGQDDTVAARQKIGSILEEKRYRIIVFEGHFIAVLNIRLFLAEFSNIFIFKNVFF